MTDLEIQRKLNPTYVFNRNGLIIGKRMMYFARKDRVRIPYNQLIQLSPKLSHTNNTHNEQ